MIAETLLHDVALLIDSRIAKVVLNDNYEITNFEVKAVTDNVLTLNYIVPASEVSLVTKIELRGPDGSVVSTHTVNLPITADTLMIQSITVKEVTN